jgi:glycosyltransferase involved in cell wall biosynthesis/GT2 family glycosyltransferase
VTVRAAVGIAVHAEPARFRATLQAVRATVPASTEIVVVPDHPDGDTEAALRGAGVRVLPAPGSPGGAACFNRLLGGTDADVCVLLESGCIPADGWLERLLDGLAADPRNGLAGPSTNRSWNAQGAEPACGPSPQAIASAGRRLAQRHGGDTRTLEPLYSLADFCYAMRREVWNALGAADEGFGAGPCWEMEYNARAARAGWRGVWVPAAFVWRAPFTARRARDDRRLFDTSRRRYQDRLCGLRLRGDATRYETHCRGDACEHFAPAALVQIRIDPPPVPVVAADERLAPPPPSPAPAIVRSPAPPTSSSGEGGAPMVSCIMPTAGRPEFALQAIAYFLAQDYPHRELIILDDAGSGLEERIPDDPRIRYEALPAGRSIGAKRNWGVQMARGEIVAQWDDDDWYAPGRLSAQAAPILAGDADVTALRAEVFFDLERWEFWSCSDLLHRRLFVHDVHGGTLAYRRSVWGTKATYPAASLAEDAAFLHRAVRGGARLKRIDTPGLFVYLRHGANAWKFACGKHVDAAGWRRTGEPPHLADARAFYLARSPSVAPPPRVRVSPVHPPEHDVREDGELVSCLMVTADRRRFVPHAIDHFLRQTWPARELVIVDDGADPVEDLVPADPRIRYLRTARSPTLGAKRNLACSLARGSLLAHWDDDDWMADTRLEAQVSALREADAEVCGLSTVRYFEPLEGRAWEFRWADRSRRWVGGNTLLYRRATWERRPFPEVNEGEDTRWVWALPSVASVADPSIFAALVHAGNTSRKQTRGANWHPIPLDVIRTAMGADWSRYAPSNERARLVPA